jgi:predicted dinucleotide-binding enzyme
MASEIEKKKGKRDRSKRFADTGNYYPRHRDGRIEWIEAGLTESRWVAQQLNRPVIKAFNNIYAEHLQKR